MHIKQEQKVDERCKGFHSSRTTLTLYQTQLPKTLPVLVQSQLSNLACHLHVLTEHLTLTL